MRKKLASHRLHSQEGQSWACFLTLHSHGQVSNWGTAMPLMSTRSPHVLRLHDARPGEPAGLEGMLRPALTAVVKDKDGGGSPGAEDIWPVCSPASLQGIPRPISLYPLCLTPYPLVLFRAFMCLKIFLFIIHIVPQE